ncbi:MAG: NTP transferase domain-containing protein [Flavobacteriales bacterium]|nr:NTP transferase domain-containing protein [Flavobacteriales bacterium]MCB9449149.1 NTP transferase domain-containing protein [Flavobacteriales bacterium]
MSQNHTYCVIMAGGVGSRFWPMSRSNRPKQFLDILGTGESLLQQTFNRFLKICPPENIMVVTHQSYRDMVAAQLPSIPKDNILGEPSRRNTAPCIAYAAYKIKAKDPEAQMIVAPSDHLVLKGEEFTRIIREALAAVQSAPILVTLGIKPSRPDTGYGYIQFTQEHLKGHDPVKKVKTFTEKPNLDMARYFMESGEFLWNSGIFVWSVNSITDALNHHLPEISSVFEDDMDKLNSPEEAGFITRAYTVCKNISIDYGVMEKADNVYVVPADFGWSDLGTWGSLYEHMPQDDNANAVAGKNVILYDSKNCVVHMPSGKLAVLQGLDDFIVVESDNVLLVCRKSEEQQIKEFVNEVKISKGEEFV